MEASTGLSASENISGGTTLGLSGDKFTLNGKLTFLLGISYFDVAGWRMSDLDALQTRRFNLARIFLDLGVHTGGNRMRSFFNPDGSMKNTESLLNFVRACAARGIVVDATILHADSNLAGDWASNAFPETAIRNAVKLLSGEPNVFFDIVNEHNGIVPKRKSWSDSHSVMNSLMSAARQAYSHGIYTFSSMSAVFGHLQHILTKDDEVIPANIDEELATGIHVLSPHFGREPDWHLRTERRVTNIKNHLASKGLSVPIYLQEESRRGDGEGAGDLPGDQFFQAVLSAKHAGAAGWIFHTTAAFDLSRQDMMSQLDPVELQIVDSIGNPDEWAFRASAKT